MRLARKLRGQGLGIFMNQTQLQLNFLAILEQIGLPVPAITFFVMLGLGNYGAYSNLWIEQFRGLACLHLLVLSGSQVQGLAQQLGRFHSLMGSNLVRTRMWSKYVFVSAVLLFYAQSVQWSPPIVRATFCFLLSSFPLRIGSYWVLGGAFMAHGVLFPSHLAQISTYLSWISYLILQMCAELNLSRMRSQVVATTLCLILTQVFFFRTHFSIGYFLTALVANIFLAFVFDFFIQWILSLAVALSLVEVLIPLSSVNRGVGWLFAVILGPFFRSAYAMLLVALRALRYIG